MISLPRLTEILAQYANLTIGLVGDLFLDRYLEIDPALEEISLETGLQAHQVFRVRNSPGALGTVINNLVALNVGRLVPITVIGDDGHGFDLRRELSKQDPVETEHIIEEPRRLTPTYTKPLTKDANGSLRELNRLDVRPRGPISETSSQAVCQRLDDLFGTLDGLIVLDQIVEWGWGVINDTILNKLNALAHKDPDKLILVDSRQNVGNFTAAVIKGNLAELTSLYGLDGNHQGAQSAIQRLAARSGRAVFCTMGEEGILVSIPDGKVELVPAFSVTGPTDIVGAGDSATSGIVASLLSGATNVEAAEIANLVASITVQQIGTTGSASQEMVTARWSECSGSFEAG